VWALDRFTREGVLETFEHIRKLTTYGVGFESYTEAHFRVVSVGKVKTWLDGVGKNPSEQVEKRRRTD
jgi:hypothetical protein